MGSHVNKANNLFLSSFTVDKFYDLELVTMRTFELGEAVTIMTVGVVPEQNTKTVLIHIVDTGASNQRGRVIQARADSDEVYAYYFSPRTDTDPSKNVMTTFMDSSQKEDYYLYTGKSNYITGSGDLSWLAVDWTDTNRKFGFFMVFTGEDHCLTKSDREELYYGPDFTEYLGNAVNETDVRIIKVTQPSRVPST